MNDLIPAPETPEMQSKTEEDRRIVLELLDEEKDLDYY